MSITQHLRPYPAGQGLRVGGFCRAVPSGGHAVKGMQAGLTVPDLAQHSATMGRPRRPLRGLLLVSLVAPDVPARIITELHPAPLRLNLIKH
ncbi:hypothetical protein AB1207_22505 [Kineococcus endophyticus]|uniref:Uncharacterized protein n=1 Tax=Kineococcus endophyticus TaxID=1181883 RepID=A0ABV3PCZ9_9ACTN